MIGFGGLTWFAVRVAHLAVGAEEGGGRLQTIVVD